MSAANRVAKNTMILYGRMAITMFISLYATRLILAALGTTDFGIFNLVAGSITMLVFLNNALTGASQRFMSYYQGDGDIIKQKSVFVVSGVIHILVGVIIIILLEVAGIFLFNGFLDIPEGRVLAAKTIYQFLIISTFLNIVTVPYDALINSHENMLLVAILGILESLIKLSIAFSITVYSGDRLILYGALMALMAVLLASIRAIYCKKKYSEVNYSIKKYYSKPVFIEMLSFAGWNLVGTGARVLSIQGMAIVLNTFFGVIVNAAQGVANQITGQLMVFSNTMLKALNPVIAKSEGANNRELMLRATQTGSKLSFYLLAFFSIPIIIEMPAILNFWLKDVPEYAIDFCRLSLIVSAVRQISVTLPSAIGATGKIRGSKIAESVIIVMLLPLAYIMFKAGNTPEYIYYVLILVELLISASRVYYAYIFCGLNLKNYLLNNVFICVLIFSSTILLSAINIYSGNSEFIRIIIVFGISTVLLLAQVYVFGLNKTEKNQIKMLIIALKKKILKNTDK